MPCIKNFTVGQCHFFGSSTSTQQNIISRHCRSIIVVVGVFSTAKYIFNSGLAKLDGMPPNTGPAKAARGKNSSLCRCRFLPPIFQMPFLIDCFLIIQNHYLLKKKSRFYDRELDRPLLIYANIAPLNTPKFLPYIFSLLHFLVQFLELVFLSNFSSSFV